jgi:hypothetical protein
MSGAMPRRRLIMVPCLALLFCVLAPFTSVADDGWASGVPVGTPFPNINANDQNGQTWTNKQLVGENGLVFYFMRSSNW